MIFIIFSPLINGLHCPRERHSETIQITVKSILSDNSINGQKWPLTRGGLSIQVIQVVLWEQLTVVINDRWSLEKVLL